MINLYLWLKAFHIIFTIAWFAGLFYIFRLFVYHIKHFEDENQAQTFCVMERKLLFIIMYPAMVLTLLFGFWMVAMAPTILLQTWFLVKLAGVLGLISYQLFASSVHNQLRAGYKPLSERACRIINEVPTVFLFLIVIMVIVRPWT